MGEFKGIPQEGIMLLAENRFMDSKSFYDENKERIKALVIEPMYALIRDLTPVLEKIDPDMNLIPSKMISRVRRDNRFTRDKSMYRENMWMMFMRDKNKYERKQPCMWFEFTPECYTYGVGLFGGEPKVMECFRECLDESGEEFLKAEKRIRNFGIEPSFDTYKKDRSAGKNEKLRLYYNAKELFFISEKRPLSSLFDGECEKELIKAVEEFAPMYKYLWKVTARVLDKN